MLTKNGQCKKMLDTPYFWLKTNPISYQSGQEEVEECTTECLISSQAKVQINAKAIITR